MSDQLSEGVSASGSASARHASGDMAMFLSAGDEQVQESSSVGLVAGGVGAISDRAT